MTDAPERPITWSFGGGVQSCAIAVLVAQGRLPTPECAVIADTGREATETWTYLREYVNPLLETVGLQVEIAPHSLAGVDLYAPTGQMLLPAFTKTGKLRTFCSSEWKKYPVRKYLRSKGYGPKRPATMWLGISVDEVHRAKPSDVQWLEYDWPLLMEIPMRREECRNLVVAAGLPTPPRSSCWMCPHRTNAEWRHLRDNHPADWDEAVELEREVRTRDDEVWLHKSREVLEEAPIDEENLDLFGECDEGFCFV